MAKKRLLKHPKPQQPLKRDAKGRWVARKPVRPAKPVRRPKTPPAASRRPSRPVKPAPRSLKKRKPLPPTRKSLPVGRKRQAGYASRHKAQDTGHKKRKALKPAAKSPVLRKIKRKFARVPQKPAKSRKPVRKIKRPTLLGKVVKPLKKRKPVKPGKPVRKAPAKPVRRKAPAKPVRRKAPAKPVRRKAPAKPVRRKAPAKPVRRKAPAKPPKPVKKKPVKPRGPWLSCDDVADRLEKQYEGLVYKDVSSFQGKMYVGRGKWNNTIWSSKNIYPDRRIKSIYLFAVYSSPTYEGKKRTGDPEFIFVGKQIGWHTTPEWLLGKLVEPGEPMLMPDNTLRDRIVLEVLLDTVFPRCGDLVELVGIRFSAKKAPPRPHTNPKKRKKK